MSHAKRDTEATPANAHNPLKDFISIAVRQKGYIDTAHKLICEYTRKLDSCIYVDSDRRSAYDLHNDGRAVNVYMMLDDIANALTGDLEYVGDDE